MKDNERLLVLRERVQATSENFKKVVRGLGQLEHDVVEDELNHDNVKVIAASKLPFKYELDLNKQQVVVILRGDWTMNEGEIERQLHVGDVVKVPLNSPYSTKLTTDELNAKFVYVQFK